MASLEKIFILLAPTFMNRFSFYFTQLSVVTISWTSSSMSKLGPRSRLKWLILEEHCHHSSTFICGLILMYYTQIFSMIISVTSSSFSFLGMRLKVKVAFFQKSVVGTLLLSFMD